MKACVQTDILFRILLPALLLTECGNKNEAPPVTPASVAPVSNPTPTNDASKAAVSPRRTPPPTAPTDAVVDTEQSDSAAAEHADMRAEDLTNIVQVCVGAAHTCALNAGGAVYCWGANRNGQLGIGERSDCRQTPVPVSGIDDAVMIACGGVHTCVLLKNGEVMCFGDNEFGQTGLASSEPTPSPTVVNGLSNIKAIRTTVAQTCAVGGNTALYCWGFNTPAGDEMPFADHPVQMKGVPAPIRDVSMGDRHLCVLKTNGTVYCKGDNTWGQISGTGEGFHRRFRKVPGIADGVQTVSGQDHNCVLQRNGSVACWGNNLTDEIQPGDGKSMYRRPVRVPELSHVEQLSAASGHICAKLDTNTAICFGSVFAMQLGADVEDLDAYPWLVEVPEKNLQSVATGERHTCAVTSSGGIDCFGDNSYGQLGNGAPERCDDRDPLPDTFGRIEGEPGRRSFQVLTY